MSNEDETEQQPSLSVPIAGTYIIQAPTDDSLGIGLIFLEGGNVHWVAVKQDEIDDQGD